MSYVGYYNPELPDCVFILLKVLLEVKDGRELVFGHIDPHSLIDADHCRELTEVERAFIYHLSRVKGYNEKTREDLILKGYPSPRHDKYYCYVFDEEVNLGTFDIERIISTDRINYASEIRQSRYHAKEYPEGRPVFLKGSELIKFRTGMVK